MTDVNVLFAVNQITWINLKKNFQYNLDGTRVREDLTVSQAKKLLHNVTGFWKSPDLGGTTYTVVSWDVPDIPTSRGANDLKWVEFLLSTFPNKFHILGAWNEDGSQFGTKITYVENGIDWVEGLDEIVTLVDKEVVDIETTIATGTLTMKTIKVEEVSYVPDGIFTQIPHYDEVIVGTPVYPIHPQILKVFPDIVNYDGSGNETSRVAATVPAEVHKTAGRGDRRWT